MASVIATIHDRASGEAARPRMDAIAESLRKINVLEQELGPPTADEKKRIDAKLEAAGKVLEARLKETLDRLEGDSETTMLVATMVLETVRPGR